MPTTNRFLTLNLAVRWLWITFSTIQVLSEGEPRYSVILNVISYYPAYIQPDMFGMYKTSPRITMSS